MTEKITLDYVGKSYKAEWGSVKFKAKAEDVAKELENMGDGFTRRQVVDYASERKDSELYKCFEWDDTVAADRYRIQQAGSIISNLKITIIKDDKPPEKTNISMFVMPERKGGTYQKTELVVKNIERYELLLNKAISELQIFKNKYSTLSELEEVFKAIDAL